MASHEQLLRDLYAAFNRREIDVVLASLDQNVDWPNGMDGTRELGHEAVRAYWLRQWKVIDPSVEPGEIRERQDGATAVRVHQVVRSLKGEVQSDRILTHAYWFANGLVSRMEIEG